MSRRRVSVEFIAEMIGFKREMRGGADEVRKVKDESRAAQAEVAKLGEVGAKAGRQLGDGIVRGADGRLRDSRGKFVSAGQRSGKDFGDGFEQGSKAGLLKVAGILGGGALKGSGSLPWQGLAAIPATAGVAAASLQAIPPVLAAIGGGLGAIPGLAAGAAGSIGILKLATAGIGDSVKNVFKLPKGADPYDQLSRNGKRFVDQIVGQKQALTDLRSLAQERVFAGLDKELASLSGTALPLARVQAIRFGDTWNQTFKQLGSLGRDPQFLSGLDTAFESTDGFFDKVNARIGPTGKSLAHLFTSSVPFVDEFGSSLLSYTDDFNTWIDRQAASGGLDRFFEDAAHQADALLDIGKEIFVIVGKIGGMQQRSTLLRDMADALERFNSEAHNMKSIEGIVATGNAAIRGVVEVLAVLGETLGETLADPGTTAAVALFFDVLKAGAAAVGDLAQLFGTLPDPVQATVLAGIALAIMATKLVGVFGKMQIAIGGAAARLRELGPAGATAARGLEASGKWAGKAAVAFIAIEAASAVFAAFRADAANVDLLASSLETLAKKGEATGEIKRIFGGDLAKLGLDAAGASSGIGKFGAKVESIVPFMRDLNEILYGTSFSSHAEDIGALDEAMAKLVETSGKQASFEAWNKLLSASGMNADELIKIFPQYEQALKDADANTGGLAQRQELLNGTMEEAVGAVGSYTKAWQELNGEVLNSDQAMLSAQKALAAVKKSFEENGQAIKGNSVAALENRVAVGEAAKAGADAAQKKYEETDSITAANAVYETYIGQLRKTLGQSSLTKAEIDTLIATYATMPPYKATEVSAPGVVPATKQVQDFNFLVRSVPPSKTVPFYATTGEAKAAVEVLRLKIAEIKSKHVYITGSVRWTSSGDLKVPGGTLTKDRWGGIHEGQYAKAETGLLREASIFSPRNPGRFMISEPATMGEAFIPKSGNAERSIGIGRRAMEWYGQDVVPKSVLAMVRNLPAAMATQSSQPAEKGPVNVRVFVGDRELTDIVRVEVSESNRGLRRRVGAGTGAQ